MKTYPDDYKVVHSIVFNFIVPICYVTDEDLIARPLFINENKLDYHLCTASGSSLHRSVLEGKLIHHINGNQFDNRKCNLIDADNKAKHEKLHAIMTEEFPEFHFSNVIDI